MQLLLQVPILLLNLINVMFQSSPFIVENRLSLLNLLHIVLHLALEVIFKEIQKIVLDVDLLNLIINRLQLAVHFTSLG